MSSKSVFIFLLSFTIALQLGCIAAEDETTVAATEPPTETPTEAPTEAPTEEPTEAPTEAPTTIILETQDEGSGHLEEDLCKETFAEHPAASCILYDDNQCDGSDGLKELGNGAILLTDTAALGFDVESISVKKGCQLSIYSGKTLNGETQFVNAIEEDLHITLEDDESLKDFDDNVNSAFCSCVAPVTYGYPVYSALPWYPNYQFYTGFYPNYFQNRLVGPQRFAYSFWH